MPGQIDLTTTKKAVRDFIEGLGRIREPIELVYEGRPVAKIIAPEELCDREKQLIRHKARAFVEKARARNRGVPAGKIAKVVDQAAKEVRAKK